MILSSRRPTGRLQMDRRDEAFGAPVGSRPRSVHGSDELLSVEDAAKQTIESGALEPALEPALGLLAVDGDEQAGESESDDRPGEREEDPSTGRPREGRLHVVRSVARTPLRLLRGVQKRCSVLPQVLEDRSESALLSDLSHFQ